MKKIVFSDKFGLTQAVLEGRKTMTRRIVKGNGILRDGEIQTVDIINGVVHLVENNYDESCNDDFDEEDDDGHITLNIPYKVGEVVAIAQSYRDVAQYGYPVDSRYDAFRSANWGDGEDGVLESSAGWNNKLFVKSELMPHHIRITDVKVERLQDISDADCLREGVLSSDKYAMPYGIPDSKAPNGVFFYYSSPREAFADLIDKVSGKGVWQSNPWVFVYTFELID